MKLIFMTKIKNINKINKLKMPFMEKIFGEIIKKINQKYSQHITKNV